MAPRSPQRLNPAPAGREAPWREGELWPGRSQLQPIGAGVYVTNFFGARNAAALAAAGITHVVVCADELPCAFPRRLTYLKLAGLTDNTHTELAAHLALALGWMRTALAGGGTVLLHCASGSSRSGAVACAHLMDVQGVDFAEALRTVQRVRPIVLPNPGFCAQLAGGLGPAVRSVLPPVSATEGSACGIEVAAATGDGGVGDLA